MSSNAPKKGDVSWREFNIHDDDEDIDEEEHEATADGAGLFLFPSEEEALLEHDVPLPPFQDGREITLQLSYQEEWGRSTGMAICRGSEVLLDFLVANEQVIQGKTVLELGSGVGLGGLTAHLLGSSRVVWTDGDVDVLENLRNNVHRNTHLENASCPQLIWGKDLDVFRETYGTFQVMLGTDLFYMSRSIEPLFQTIHELLTADGVFVAVNTCASQSPITAVFDIANKYGFSWCSCFPKETIELASMLDPENAERNKGALSDLPDGDGYDERIYLFYRTPSE